MGGAFGIALCHLRLMSLHTVETYFLIAPEGSHGSKHHSKKNGCLDLPNLSRDGWMADRLSMSQAIMIIMNLQTQCLHTESLLIPLLYAANLG